MSNNETFKNTNEAEKNPVEEVEVPEFKTSEQSNEVTQKLTEDYEKAEALASETLKQIREMGKAELMKGKVESMPQTEAEKRLYENVGYDVESLTSDKEAFAKMSNAEMYNALQIKTLEKTKAFLVNAGKGVKPEDIAGLNLVLKKINSVLEGAANNKGDNALKGYADIMKENVNKKADGYMAYDGLSKLYSKSGYDSSMFNSGKVYESFQNDLAESVLTKDQQEAFSKMQKEATKNSGNKASSFAAGGMSQKMKVEPIFSSKTTQELGAKYNKAA